MVAEIFPLPALNHSLLLAQGARQSHRVRIAFTMGAVGERDYFLKLETNINAKRRDLNKTFAL